MEDEVDLESDSDDEEYVPEGKKREEVLFLSLHS